ncbi:MAG TPA: DNA internalization-related competence protein ComEC/Rec2 [Gammaproteobacteria bacterium]|nr:DNA internalization-related competence protein ComEC/Rec2 [Gammaproteobacteria bacterium]
MTFQVILFVAGILVLHLQAKLPAISSLLLVAAAVTFLASRRLRPVAIFSLGFLWAAFHNMLLTAQGLPEDLQGRTLLIEGVVLERPPATSGIRMRFLLQADRLDTGEGWQSFATRVRLDWYGEHGDPQPGERWQLAVRLRRPGGYANPGGFDYEQWLYRERIRATGYVRSDDRNLHIGSGSVAVIDSIRNSLSATMVADSRTSPSMALVQALTVGQRNRISQEQWQILRATGTSHLMAISGLHISLVAGLVFGCVRLAWARSAMLSTQLLPVRAAALAALLAATLYALLSGFAIPAQRALIMVALLMVALMSGRRATFPGVISIAALVTLLLDPVSILSAGWWLSFSAVTIIAWFAIGRTGYRYPSHRWFLMPVILAICMMPLLVLFFQQVSLVAPLANILAVPWVSFLVVPLALAGTVMCAFSEPAGLAVLQLSAWILDVLWQALAWLADLDIALASWPQPAGSQLLLASLGMACLFVPRGMPGRWAGVMLLLPMLLAARLQPAPNEVRVSLLDVGQGLSAVIRTARHTLVYDTGPAFGSHFDTGRAVLVPYLRSQGITHVDRLFISHGDNDHIGGARSLLAAYPADEVLSSVPFEYDGREATACRRGMRWSWDGVMFTVMHPQAGDGHTGNDASCVLRISVAGGLRLLLTGDIERAGEHDLLVHYGEELKSSVLVVPHHGSRTSSTATFVAAVSPALALVPAGHRNRYRFPRPEVMARYKENGSQVLETGKSGAISVILRPHARHPVVRRFRQSWPRLWRRTE